MKTPPKSVCFGTALDNVGDVIISCGVRLTRNDAGYSPYSETLHFRFVASPENKEMPSFGQPARAGRFVGEIIDSKKLYLQTFEITIAKRRNQKQSKQRIDLKVNRNESGNFPRIWTGLGFSE